MSKNIFASMTFFEAPKVLPGGSVHSSGEVFERFKDYQKSDREMMLCLYLNPKNDLIHVEVHSIGTVDSSAVYPREIVRLALVKSASSVILVHNHPSGDPEPSLCDKEITKSVYGACKLLDVKLLDHIVLGSGRFFSFADHGLMDGYNLFFINLGL
jgi:DNA repair protein RadC